MTPVQKLVLRGLAAVALGWILPSILPSRFVLFGIIVLMFFTITQGFLFIHGIKWQMRQHERVLAGSPREKEPWYIRYVSGGSGRES